MDVLLVGHRGSGKSTLGAAAARLLHAEHLDLDAHIEAATGLSPAQHLARDPAAFRRLELESLAHLTLNPGDAPLRIITPGAGIQQLPGWCLIIWIWRDGWERTALTERARLRPDLSWDDEVAWMRATREPRWAAASHLRLDISRGRTPDRAALQLAHLIRWTLSLPASPSAQRTWIVPANPDQLTRAASDATLLGVAGLELRSDLIPEPPKLTLPTLMSLRHADPMWLVDHAQHAAMIDLDLNTLDPDGGCPALDHLSPRPLLLSAHPPAGSATTLAALHAAAERLARAHPRWADHLQLKHAPTPASLAELDTLLAELDAHPAPYPTTFLPQGRRFAWLRPWLMARGNQTNYLPVGLAPARIGGAPAPTPWDLQDWLPHLCGAPEQFDMLIGDPVDASAGDWWHRAAALAEGDPRSSYVKAPLPADADDAEWAALLRIMARVGVRGVSVTAPHKQRVLTLPDVQNPHALTAANTLVRDGADGWIAHDTDEIGMTAALAHLEAAGVAPGEAAVMGRGGVSPAVLRALAARGWRVTTHASAREGWPADTSPVALIVQASGDHDRATAGAPACEAWLDLHYQGVAAPSAGALHINGDVFFEAQAAAQRALWRRR